MVCEAISKSLSIGNNRVAIGDSLHTTNRQLQKVKTIFLFREARSHVMNDVITSNKHGRCQSFMISASKSKKISLINCFFHF